MGHKGFHQARMSWHDFFWTVSGILAGCTLSELVSFASVSLLHKSLSPEQEIIVFVICLILAIIAALLISMGFSRKYRQAKADAEAGYSAQPRRLILREILLCLLLNGCAGALLYLLLLRKDLQN